VAQPGPLGSLHVGLIYKPKPRAEPATNVPPSSWNSESFSVVTSTGR
jgi:hypothetical protein